MTILHPKTYTMHCLSFQYPLRSRRPILQLMLFTWSRRRPRQGRGREGEGEEGRRATTSQRPSPGSWTSWQPLATPSWCSRQGRLLAGMVNAHLQPLFCTYPTLNYYLPILPLLCEIFLKTHIEIEMASLEKQCQWVHRLVGKCWWMPQVPIHW